MGSLAVIGTFYRRPWAYGRVAASVAVQTRAPDNIWAMFEDPKDGEALFDIDNWGIDSLDVQVVPMGFAVRPGVNPLGVAINMALDLSHDDYVVYLTDDSLPHPDKYRLMAQALDENPDWGAVYCSQDYGQVGSPADWLAADWGGNIRMAAEPEAHPFQRVDHTQVMHHRTSARWPTDYGVRQLSDAHFFRDLVAEVGPLMPVPAVLDWTRQLPDGLSRR